MPEMISRRSKDIFDQGKEKQEVVLFGQWGNKFLGNVDVHIENEDKCSSRQSSLPFFQELSVVANKT
jgi:hypothetical protein